MAQRTCDSDSEFTALIFGASGIIGWGVTLQAILYPAPQAFKRVIALTNRPLTKKDAYLPNDSRLDIHSGIDLTKGVEEANKALAKIRGIGDVTHVYFTAYTAHTLPYLARKAANVSILTTAVKAVTSLSPSLRFWTYFGGGKAYGLEFAAEIASAKIPLELRPQTPFSEASPRLPQPWGDNIFYYAQYDAMVELSAGQPWRFAEIRPDAVVGFVPNGNAMNIAQNLGLWLSLVRSIEGEGAEAVFPGSEVAWRALHSDSSQDLTGRFAVFVSLQNEDRVGNGTVVNIADGVTTWEQDWPEICKWFGLTGVGPTEGVVTGKEWVMAHKDAWEGWVRENGLRDGILEANDWDFIAFLMTVESDRQFDIGKAKWMGFGGEIGKSGVVKGYEMAFERMRKAKMIP